MKYMRQWGSTTGGAQKTGMERLLISLLTGCMVLGLLGGGACANGTISQPPGNPGENSGETATPPGMAAPVPPVPPVEPLPPPAIPETPYPADPVFIPPPPDSNLSPANTLDATTLISRQAYQLTLTLDDMGPGWARGNAAAPAIQQVTSSSHVCYTQGSAYTPGVQNSVAVYRSIAVANKAYAREKEANHADSNPNIGDECLLNDSAPINRLLIFRKNNVVVWVWLKQYKEGDIERYARIVEQRINAALSPVLPEPSSQITSTPSQQAPVEPSNSLQPVITIPVDGLITRQAYLMVLTKEGAKPFGVTVSYPSIGDKCFLNDSVPIDKLLVVREGDVVTWIW